MTLPIVLYGNPVLRKKGASAFPLTKERRKLIEDMLETMRQERGIGLAAQQVGYALQLAVVDVSTVEDRPSKMWIKDKEVDPKEHMPLLLLDPKVRLIKSKEIGWEGCLSFPNIEAQINRSKRVHVITKKEDGTMFEFEAAGLLGRAIQHEYDHLQGVLFTDRMSPEDLKTLRPQIDAIREVAAQNF
ncbi:MAG: peptide deformylase [bacterium]